jgi:hypothetical protein
LSDSGLTKSGYAGMLISRFFDNKNNLERWKMARNRLKRIIGETLAIKTFLLLTVFFLVAFISAIHLFKIKYDGWLSLAPLLGVSVFFAAIVYAVIIGRQEKREEKNANENHSEKPSEIF